MKLYIVKTNSQNMGVYLNLGDAYEHIEAEGDFDVIKPLHSVLAHSDSQVGVEILVGHYISLSGDNNTTISVTQWSIEVMKLDYMSADICEAAMRGER
jgi:hypothetical protein